MNVIIRLRHKGEYNHFKVWIGKDQLYEYKINYKKANIHHASLAVHYLSILFAVNILRKMEHSGIVNIYTTSDLLIGQVDGSRKIIDKKNNYKQYYELLKTKMYSTPIKFNFHKLKKKA